MREPRAKAVPTVKIDNDTVRVTEWRFAPGAHTGHHRHEYPYVVVPMTTGPLTIITGSTESQAPLTLGAPYFRHAGVEHDVANPNPTEFVFIEVELKRS
jgi:quercetin dioxygenase-like cupin family protein